LHHFNRKELSFPAHTTLFGNAVAKAKVQLHRIFPAFYSSFHSFSPTSGDMVSSLLLDKQETIFTKRVAFVAWLGKACTPLGTRTQLRTDENLPGHQFSAQP
jgi:ABC-type cobalt transport system substrate-binding protein